MNDPPARLIFAGTPAFAVPSLEALLGGPWQVCAVYTQPDRPAGRGRRLQPGPVKRRAAAAGLEVRQPPSLADPDTQAALAALAPDLMVVVAYGLLIPPAVLAIPRRGCINVHASLLPRWRGAAPIQRAILAGDVRTGISLMQMDRGLDTGPVFATADCPIEPATTAGALHDRLAALGAATLARWLPGVLYGTLTPQAQDDAQATYASKLRKDEAELDWRRPAVELERQVRAFNPWPVAQTRSAAGVLRVWQARALETLAGGAPGTVVSQDPAGIDVTTGTGVLRLEALQVPGGRVMSAAAFLAGRDLAGQVLGLR